MNKIKQTGAALITSLVILVILTLLGITAMKSSTTQELIVGNLQESLISQDCANTLARQVQAALVSGTARTAGNPVDRNGNTPLQPLTGVAAVACSNITNPSFQYTGQRIIPGSINGCLANMYEVTAQVNGTNAATQAERTITLALGLNPAFCN